MGGHGLTIQVEEGVGAFGVTAVLEKPPQERLGLVGGKDAEGKPVF